MLRPIRTIPALLASMVLAGSLFSTSAGAANTTTAYSVNPKTRVHPYLQIGAQAEPNKMVTVLVSKTSSRVSSSSIAKAVPTSVLQDFPAINTFAITIPQKAALNLANTPGVRYVTPNLRMRTTAIDASQLKTTYEGTLGTPNEWNGLAPLGATGKGVGVAVLDTGVNTKLADLSTNSTLDNKRAQAVGGSSGLVRSVPSSECVENRRTGDAYSLPAGALRQPGPSSG